MDSPKTSYNTSKLTLSSFDRILLNIVKYYDDSVLDNYDEWRKFSMACYNCKISIGFWDSICRKYKNYDKTKNDELYKSLKGKDIKVGWNTLFKYTNLEPEMQDMLKIFNGLSSSCGFLQFDYPVLLYFLFGNDYIYSNKNVCCWDKTTKLWVKDYQYLFNKQVKMLRTRLEQGYKKYLGYKEKQAKIQEYYGIYDKAVKDVGKSTSKINLLGSITYCDKIREAFTLIVKAKNSTTSLENGVDYNEKSRCLFQFRNGCYDFKTGTFRERTRQDLISICLDYDYTPDIDEDIVQRIEGVLRRIQPDTTQYVFMMSFLGYGLTGETKLQKFITNVGHSASNGKSLIQSTLCKVFPIYCYKVDGDIYTINSKYRQKELSYIINHPVRLLFTGELTSKRLDTEFIKDFVDGGVVKIKPLYAEGIDVKIQCKILQNSNHDMNVDCADAGFRRRCLVQYYESKFVDDGDDMVVDESKNIYKKDEDIINWFDDYPYKIALFHILKEYATKYYTSGLTIPKCIRNNGREMIDENDDIANIMEGCLDITNDVNDLVPKQYIIDLAEGNTKLLRSIKKWLKSKGVKYLKHIQINKKRGVWAGVKSLTQDPFFDEDL